MKRLLPLLLVFLTGCAGPDPAMEAAIDLRTRCLSGPVSFETEVRADYITSIECFTLDCAFDGAGEMTFSVTEPEEIAGIRGTVRGTEGTMEFDETALAFPLLAEGRLSPLSAPSVPRTVPPIPAISSGSVTVKVISPAPSKVQANSKHSTLVM